ncbi:hypothetical protein AFAE65S_03679 [Alcaligenes phenolicus]|jgi:hypothetical protein
MVTQLFRYRAVPLLLKLLKCRETAATGKERTIVIWALRGSKQHFTKPGF